MVSKSDSPQSPDGPSSFDETTGISYGDRSSPGLEEHAAIDYQKSEVSNSGSQQEVVNLTGLISRMSGNASADVIVPSSEVHSSHFS